MILSMPKNIEFRLNIVLLFILGLSLLIRSHDLLIVVSFIGTLFVVYSAGKAIVKRKITVDLLAGIALVASIIAREWMSAVFINLMITSARIFGNYTENVAGLAIRSLLKLRPEKVKVEIHGEIKEIGLGEVKVGDRVIVESGDRIPVDGEIIEGQASIDQSSLTGESIPVARGKGEKVLSSTLNVSGSLIVRAEKIGKDTTFEKIIKLVEVAGMGKVHIETLGQKFASWYVTLSLIGATVIYLATKDLPLVLSVLLVVCADDIAVAIPMAFWAAVGHAARRGIIIKGGDFLEAITKLKVLVVDKTGTLTKGKINVTGVVAFGSNTPERILRLIAQAESISEHPIAKAIVEYAKNKEINFKTPEEFNEYPGKGVSATIDGKKVIVGTPYFLREKEVVFNRKEKEEIQSFYQGGVNLIAVAVGGEVVGIVTIEDEIRPRVKETIEAIKKFGVDRVYMLTGDNEYVAKKVAIQAGIEDFKANLLPEDKLEFIKSHLNPSYKLAMVGDGVNDAASLRQADIGIAMGAIGSDVAIESADIALMNDDFSKIKEVISIGTHTVNVAKQNFVIWGGINLIGLALVFAHVIGPSGAAAFNFVTDFFPLINSLRILRYKFQPEANL